MDFRFSGSGIVFRDAAHEDRLKSSGGVLVDLLVKLIVDLSPNNDDVRHGHPPGLSCSDWGESFLLVAEILAQPCHVCARASHFAFLGRRLKKSLGRALGGGRCSGERLRGISDRVGTFALLRFQAPVLVDWEERPTGPRALTQQVSETTSTERVPVAHRLEQSENRGAIAAIALGLIEGSVGATCAARVRAPGECALALQGIPLPDPFYVPTPAGRPFRRGRFTIPGPMNNPLGLL
jgi:hypothetical protein